MACAVGRVILEFTIHLLPNFSLKFCLRRPLPQGFPTLSQPTGETLCSKSSKVEVGTWAWGVHCKVADSQEGPRPSMSSFTGGTPPISAFLSHGFNLGIQPGGRNPGGDFGAGRSAKWTAEEVSEAPVASPPPPYLACSLARLLARSLILPPAVCQNYSPPVGVCARARSTASS